MTEDASLSSLVARIRELIAATDQLLFDLGHRARGTTRKDGKRLRRQRDKLAAQRDRMFHDLGRIEQRIAKVEAAMAQFEEK